jgi:hypothetical protein
VSKAPGVEIRAGVVTAAKACLGRFLTLVSPGLGDPILPAALEADATPR